MSVWVADAGPIILLAKARQLGLLTLLADEILLPNAVVREIRRGASDDPGRLALEAGFGTPTATGRIPAAVRALSTLDSGERAVLTLARKRGDSIVLVDDKRGRSGADALGIPKIGTLGVIIAARKKRLLPALTPVLHDLMQAGLYLDTARLQAAAASVGETWP